MTENLPRVIFVTAENENKEKVSSMPRLHDGVEHVQGNDT
jgi:hypothetical protein